MVTTSLLLTTIAIPWLETKRLNMGGSSLSELFEIVWSEKIIAHIRSSTVNARIRPGVSAVYVKQRIGVRLRGCEHVTLHSCLWIATWDRGTQTRKPSRRHRHTDKPVNEPQVEWGS